MHCRLSFLFSPQSLFTRSFCSNVVTLLSAGDQPSLDQQLSDALGALSLCGGPSSSDNRRNHSDHDNATGWGGCDENFHPTAPVQVVQHHTHYHYHAADTATGETNATARHVVTAGQEPAPTATRRSLQSAPPAAPPSATTDQSQYRMHEDISSSEEEESPPKVRKTEDYAVIDVDEDDDDDDPEEMDADAEVPLPDENRKPPAKTLHGITLSFVSGPLEGQVFNMIKGEIETLIVGFDPVPKANASVLEIVDDALGASHVKLQLEVQFKKHWRLQVTDLKPKNGGNTSIGASAIASGKTLAAGPGQTIHLGQTQVLVLRYKGAKADYAVAEPERTPTRRKRNVAATIDNSPQVVEDAKPAPMEVVKPNATARLVVTAGPYKGKEYFLGKGGSEKILFGSKPSTKAKNVDTIPLSRDTNMKGNHARLEFVGNKKCLKINVTNVSKGRTLIDVNLVSKDRIAFSGQTITIGDTVMRVEAVSS
jgi:hypothetical protein